jgi:ATP/maltotriose-dependent transcriptional regulator MalT
MVAPADLVEGREAFIRRAWGTAYERLRAVGITQLAPADLGSLATAAYLVGDRDVTTEALEQSFHRNIDADEPLAAVRDANWLTYVYTANGSPAVGAGWAGRALRLLESMPEDRVERGHLTVHEMMTHIYAGDFPVALRLAGEILEIGQRWGDGDLTAMGLQARGRLLLYAGEVRQGLALLDEAMVRVTGGEVHPILTGEILCSLIEACQEIGDYRRISDWTRALTRWCEAQPDLVPFTGQCAVHRAQLMQLHGDYAEALTELAVASERYAANGQPPATGLARYERGEVLRVQGEYAGAQSAYDEALSYGHEAQPGLSLLWMARGRTAAAVASVRRQLDESHNPVARARLLPAAVEILIRCNAVEDARAAAAELEEIAERFACAALSARAAYASGAVLLADGAAGPALTPLRRAWKIWIDLGARYEAAQSRMQMALALRALGDEDSAASELGVAERAFAEIGAHPAEEVARRLKDRALPDGLTAREVEVLRLVAAGQSNPQIATALFLSHKTVQRHLSNIFTKTGATSRTAAAAYAFEHQLA